MCDFISAIIRENWDVICLPEYTDSHEDLMRHAGLRDDHLSQGRFVRVEFTPPDDGGQIADVSKWRLKLDERSAPEWWDSERAAAKMSRIAKRMIVSGARDVIIGGCWILDGDAKIGCMIGARVFVMRGNSSVGKMWGSSNVGEMWGSSHIGKMWENSNVGGMRGAASIKKDERIKHDGTK